VTGSEEEHGGTKEFQRETAAADVDVDSGTQRDATEEKTK
jgi:hypothetical protein